VNKIINMQGLF